LTARVFSFIAPVAAFALALYGFAFAGQFWRVIPVMDGWGGVLFLEHLWSAPYHHIVINQHNEQRIPWVRLLYVLDFSLFEGRASFLYATLVAHIIALAGLLGLIIARGTNGMALMFVAISLAIFTAPIQIMNLVNPPLMLWWSVDVFSIAALYCATLAIERRSERHLALAIFLSAMALCGAMTGFITVALVVAASIFVSPRGSIAACCASAILAVWYFIGYVPQPQPARLNVHSAAGIISFIYGFCVQIGTFAQGLGLRTCAITGAAGLLLWSVLAILFLRRWLTTRFDAATACLLAVAAFCAISAALSTYTRAGAGMYAMTVSRYATNALLFWIATAGILRRLHDHRIAMVIFGVVLLGAYFPNRYEIQTTAMQAKAATVVTEQLRRGEFDRQEFAKIFPAEFDMSPTINYLRRNKLSIFAD